MFFWLSPCRRGGREGRADVTEPEIWHPSGKQPQEERELGVGAAGAWEGQQRNRDTHGNLMETMDGLALAQPLLLLLK